MKYLITGLGNPGEEYRDTRHNIGFIALDAIAAAANATFKTERYGDVVKIKHRGKILVLLKPSTYMNLSGKAIRYWLEKENIPVEKSLIIADDIALPTGMLRMKKKGSDGGHNGLADIIRILSTSKFNRLRIGVGNGFSKGKQVDFVLGRWTKEEEEILTPKIKKVVEMVKSFVVIGADRTMNFFNEKAEKKE
ncbi:MAG: aminoacyl-tRNA hydrolase [Bacteroidota bacterium]|nr:aminoacyl-tRNA hydrolase [Bacteroidota bacterium]